MMAYEAMPLYVRRIERIVASAIVNNVECIVLGAWGCGAFGQNPMLIARAFATVLNNYGGYFKKIIFAVRPTSDGEESAMYKIFKDTLTEYYNNEVEE